MPVAASRVFTATYSRASDIPQQVWEVLGSNARAANVILPLAEKALANELAGYQTLGRNTWIVCATSTSPTTHSIDFVLSCTDSPLGSYPVFVFPIQHTSLLNEDFLFPRLSLLVQALCDAVSTSRVYSVFSPDNVTRMFVDLWTHLTGIPCIPTPYYSAMFSVCTLKSYRDREISIHPSLTFDLRLGEEKDTDIVADLCYKFAQESEPFILTKEGALKEAKWLIGNKLVWVHGIQQRDEASDIASIVCTTRNSATVATITKVYTNPKWRRLGCAERLVRRVSKILLKTKESVVLYVAHGNLSAAKVYHRVGFVGLDGEDRSEDGVEPWLEVGFDRQFVELGHW